VKLVIALGNKVSLKDVAKHRVLAELADVLDRNAERPSRLLQKLSEEEASEHGALVCLPFARGNAGFLRTPPQEVATSALHGAE
jgi:hypothetical protein